MDQPWVCGRQRRGLEVQPGEFARPMVEHHHVRCGEQGAELFAACLIGEVECQAVLVAVPGDIAGLAPCPVAFRRLELQDLGAEIRQQHGGHRAGKPL